MLRPVFKAMCFLAAALLLACAPQRKPVPPGTIPAYHPATRADKAYGRRVFKELQANFPPDRHPDDYARVEHVVTRLARAAGAQHADWQIHIFRADRVINAAATKGEYIFVWSGMLKYISDDHELAAVMAHEIGHVLAGHTTATAEEEAGQILVQAGKIATQSVIGSQGYMGLGASLAGDLAGALLGAAVVNPESQRAELEADQIGLFMLARAGYNPARAIQFWHDAQSNPQLANDGFSMFSTHPSGKERLQQLQSYLPAAMRIYEQHPVSDSFNIGAEDSFSINRPVQSRDRLDGPTENVWIVQAEFTPVFSAPDARSALVSYLYYNRAVLGEKRSETWLRISQPVKGYVKSGDLAPKH